MVHGGVDVVLAKCGGWCGGTGMEISFFALSIIILLIGNRAFSLLGHHTTARPNQNPELQIHSILSDGQ